MHHYQIVAKKPDEEHDGLVIASYTPGSGYAMHVSRRDMMDYMQDYAGDEPFVVVLQKGEEAEEGKDEESAEGSAPKGRRRHRGKDDKPEGDASGDEPQGESGPSPLAPF